ncbi:MAG: hypothetical protein JNK72_24630 [Myxococcales bacterium]|nr:hypothetical protein [Myxococcales bacterium]
MALVLARSRFDVSAPRTPEPLVAPGVRAALVLPSGELLPLGVPVIHIGPAPDPTALSSRWDAALRITATLTAVAGFSLALFNFVHQRKSAPDANHRP